MCKDLKNARNNMYFIIKLMLIILLNQTSAHITQDVETTILPAWKPTRRNKVLLTLKTFGKQIHLKLCRNDKTASSAFKVWKHDEKYRTKEPQINSTDSCYYHHNDHISSAVINICHQYGWEGLIFLKNDTLEIRPWRNDFASLTLNDNSCIEKEAKISFGKLHLIIKSFNPFANSNFHNINLHNVKVKRHVQNKHKKLTIRLAVFVDEAAYSMFMSILDDDTEKMRKMILAYVNNIQALFHHSSLGTSIDISLVHLAFMHKQLDNNNKDTLWNSFCNYANANNRPKNAPDHWDLALYLAKIDIYMINHSINNNPIAASVHDTICTNKSCAVVEFGVDDVITSGFASSIVAAHEIGQILGMLYDEDVKPIACKSDYMMSKFIKKRGQVTWSKCSRNIAKKLWNTKRCLRDRRTSGNIVPLFPSYDHSLYDDLPGREWNAKAQCEIYFHNKDANVVALHDMCQSLECREAEKKETVFTGPALEGTYCDTYIDILEHEKECRGGECVLITQPPYISKYYGIDNWSEWEASSCRSMCLEKSTGFVVKRRFCTHETKRTANCREPYYDVVLCNDSLICANISRQTISNFTEMKCTEFKSLAENIHVDQAAPKVPGLQAHYDVEKPWLACVIFCRRKDSTYAPCWEMIEINMDPYFPDGTWCHHEGGQDYHCHQHYCLPSVKNIYI